MNPHNVYQMPHIVNCHGDSNFKQGPELLLPALPPPSHERHLRYYGWKVWDAWQTYHNSACACGRQVKGTDDSSMATKHALWWELAEAGFARTAAAIWLLPLLQLLLRVQLNILGRQLFLESNLLEPRCSLGLSNARWQCKNIK